MRLGEAVGPGARPRVAGDLDLVRGLPGTDNVVLGEAARDSDVVLEDDEGLDAVPLVLGDPGTERW